MPNEFNADFIKAKMRRVRENRGILSGGKPVEGKVQGSGPVNRHGMPQLPPGQRKVPNWPVLDLGVLPHITPEQWSLTVTGDVENPFTLSWDDFFALPQVTDTSDFHCVTGWSRMDNVWEGVRFSTLAQKAKIKSCVKFVFISGYDDYSTNLKLEEALDDDVLLVHKWEHLPLPREHGGPIRMITPKKYAWKGSKWIKEIVFLPEDQLGFWEIRGYSNTAEPWYEDRYAERAF